MTAEPVLWGRGPQRHLSGLKTTNPAVISAWTNGTVVTGDAVFDRISEELEITEIHSFWTESPSGTYHFRPFINVLFNERVWTEQLLATQSAPEDPIMYVTDDGEWTWPGSASPVGDAHATAQVDFTFGWGDCAVACGGFHTLRALVTPETVDVYDLGGDPLPPNLHLSPNTRPYPP